jgi:UDP-N-acetylglucosamine--N-acetylmuramyl-(pentapeptide) pyrophosphoryl-undecaprenol N-acetylglucosamine transferase
VRKDFFDIEARVPNGKVNLLIFGGSQGARAINNAVIDSLSKLDGMRETLSITHQTGDADFDRIKNAYEEAGWTAAQVRAYISDMMGQFSQTDLIVCRAGATTCAELAAAGKPAIMIPLPTAADDHQRKNAEALERAGAAKMILQSELSGKVLAERISELASSPDTLRKMGNSARKLAKKDAAAATADIIEELAKK